MRVRGRRVEGGEDGGEAGGGRGLDRGVERGVEQHRHRGDRGRRAASRGDVVQGDARHVQVE